MSDHVSDELLASRALEGCLDSFELLVERYQVPLVQFLVQRMGKVEDAEDLTQETMVRAYQNLHRYRTKWRFSTWLFTIARRLCINHQRHSRAQRRDCRRVESASLAEVFKSGDDPGELIADRETNRHLWALVASVLSEPKFTVLWLYYVEELPILEIARVVGRSRVAVKTMMFRARKQLVPVLGNDPGEATTAVQNQGMYKQLAQRLLATRQLVAEASSA
ncbi:MAG: RNA polymerase sigma factor [Planctomycetales bacterium]